MASTPKRAVIIGFDCALPSLIEKHIAEGHLPAFKKVFETGVVADNCLVPFPTITPPNWATIATGAWPGTHGITDFHVHSPGTTPSNANAVEAFSSDRCQAEYLWDAADKAGKKCIVLNYPGSWPSHLKNGIMVGGAGLTAGEYRDGLWGLESQVTLCGQQLITTGSYPNAIRLGFVSATGWQGADDLGEDPLEMSVPLLFPRAKRSPAPTTWYLLVRQTGDKGYDQVTLSPSKDIGQALCTLTVGQWSPKIITGIRMADGTECEVAFRCKLLELSEDGEDLRFLLTNMSETTGWSEPGGIAREIVSPNGLPIHGGGLGGYSLGWFDQDTYIELNEMGDQWLADAAVTLLTTQEWDLFFMHSHPPDWMYHAVMTDMDPVSCSDEQRREQAWRTHLRIYQSQDRLLARIMECMDSSTLVVLVSDHGAVADGPKFDPYKALVPAGLTVMAAEQGTAGLGFLGKAQRIAAQKPDAAASKALPQRSVHVYVNLKGRDPEGVVDPAEYENVQQQIIDVLLAYVDPETGKRPVALALSRRDARNLGLYGDGVGDVIYAVYPWFGSQHGQALPTAKWGVGSLHGLLVLNGPAIKRGCRMERTAWLTDIVPTVCYLLDLPLPAQAEGSILWQALKDPQVKIKELAKLRDGLARMETAVQRSQRQPWDKHDCA